MIRLVIAASLLTCLVFPQSKQTARDVGENIELLKTMSKLEWQVNKPGCYLIYSDGRPVQIISTEGADIVVSFYGFEHHPDRAAFAVIVLNKGTEAIDLQPDLFWGMSRQPKEKYMVFLSPEEIGKSLQRSAAWQGALLGLSAAFATTTASANSTTTGNWNGTVGSRTTSGTFNQSSTGTVRVPDEAARAQAQEQARELHESANAKSDATNSVGLRRNTLFPGQKIMGFVWFTADKHTGKADLLLPITNQKHSSGVIFVFPQEFPRQ